MINPIIGSTPLNVGSNVLYTCSTGGGTWSSSNNSIATVDTLGIVTAVAVGVVQIIYTVGNQSTAFQLTTQSTASLTNGFNYNLVYGGLQNRVLWRSQGAISDSLRYFEDFHPLCNTQILEAVRPKDGSTMTQYLAQKQSSVIMEMVNAVYNAPQVIDRAKLAFYRLAGNQLPQQFVANNNQFVGLRLNLGMGDRSVKLNSLQVWFTKSGSMNIHLYNDMILAPVLTIPISWIGGQQTVINLGEQIVLSNLVPTAYKQGTWYLGYYQSDLIGGTNDPTTQAVYYPVNYGRYFSLNVLAFSANLTIDQYGNRNFVRNNIGANNLMYGMNLEISSFVDATNMIVQNSHLFDELIGLNMSKKVLSDVIFNYQTTSVQRAIESVAEVSQLYGELHGFKADEHSPYIKGLNNKLDREIYRVKQALQPTDTVSLGIP